MWFFWKSTKSTKLMILFRSKFYIRSLWQSNGNCEFCRHGRAKQVEFWDSWVICSTYRGAAFWVIHCTYFVSIEGTSVQHLSIQVLLLASRIAQRPLDLLLFLTETYKSQITIWITDQYLTAISIFFYHRRYHRPQFTNICRTADCDFSAGLANELG